MASFWIAADGLHHSIGVQKVSPFDTKGVQANRPSFRQSGGQPGSTREKPSGAWYPSQVADYLYKKMSDGKFYVICPDNDVTAEKDKKRMLWSVGDIVNERPPLSRWREEYKEEAEQWMTKQKV